MSFENAHKFLEDDGAKQLFKLIKNYRDLYANYDEQWEKDMRASMMSSSANLNSEMMSDRLESDCYEDNGSKSKKEKQPSPTALAISSGTAVSKAPLIRRPQLAKSASKVESEASGSGGALDFEMTEEQQKQLQEVLNKIEALKITEPFGSKGEIAT